MHDTKTPLRLALVAHRIERNDGQGRVNYELARAALAVGMQVTLLAAYCAEEIASHPNAHFVRLGRESRPTQLWRNLAFAHEATKWLQKNRDPFHVLQANGFVTWEPCDIVAMHFVHSSWMRNPFYPFRGSVRPYALYQRAFTALNSRWEKQILRSARYVTAVSAAVAQDVQALGVPKERIEIIANGVDVEEFHPGPAERAAWSLPEDAPVALFVGDIRSPRKNLRTLLRALQHLPTLHLAVAGDPGGSSAPALAKDLGIAERVHFVGKISNVPSLMRSADVFVFPSWYEPYGLVVAEAMASGLPAIVSKNVGCVQSFADVLEVLQDPDDAESLAGVIEGLLQSPERRRSMSARGRARALEVSWANTTAAYLSLYERVARSRGTTLPEDRPETPARTHGDR